MKLNNQQLAQIETAATILRAYPLFPMVLANKINALVFAVKPTLKQIRDNEALFKEKSEAISKLCDTEEIKKAGAQFDSDLTDHMKAVYEVDLPAIKIAEFDNIEITGCKSVAQQNGQLVEFNYRDAFYDLQEALVII